MSYVQIKEKAVQAAYEFLADQEETARAAAARAMVHRKEYALKHIEAEEFLAATGNNMERQAKARTHPRVEQAREEYFLAVEEDEKCRNHRNKCIAIIDAYRSQLATTRAQRKI